MTDAKTDSVKRDPAWDSTFKSITNMVDTLNKYGDAYAIKVLKQKGAYLKLIEKKEILKPTEKDINTAAIICISKQVSGVLVRKDNVPARIDALNQIANNSDIRDKTRVVAGKIAQMLALREITPKNIRWKHGLGSVQVAVKTMLMNP